MKLFKKTSALFLVFVMLLSLIGCQGESTGTDAKTTTAAETKPVATTQPTPPVVKAIKIGAIFPLSGTNADNGKQNVNGAELAVKQINDAGGIKSLGGAKLELVVSDNMSDTNQCKAVAERMLSDKSVVTVIGAAASAYVMPMLPVFEKAGTPLVTAQLADAITSQGYKYVFETTAKGSDWGKMQIEFIKWLNNKYALGITKVGVIYENTEWGQSNAKGSVDMAKSSGLDVVYNQSFPVGFADASSLIAGLIKSGAQVVIPSCYTQDAKTIVNTMKSMNYFPVIFGGGGGFLYPAFEKEFGEGVIGIASTSADNLDTKNMIEDVKFKDVPTVYKAQYKEFMAEQAVGSYGNIFIIAQALEAAGSIDKDKIKDAIRALNINTPFPGGPVKFNDAGLNVNAVPVIVQWQKLPDGSIQPRAVYPESVATSEYILPQGMKK